MEAKIYTIWFLVSIAVLIYLVVSYVKADPQEIDEKDIRIAELEVENGRLRSALDDCGTAPFETVDQIRQYARIQSMRTALEGGDGR